MKLWMAIIKLFVKNAKKKKTVKKDKFSKLCQKF